MDKDAWHVNVKYKYESTIEIGVYNIFMYSK